MKKYIIGVVIVFVVWLLCYNFIFYNVETTPEQRGGGIAFLISLCLSLFLFLAFTEEDKE